jgi:uncharacterized protein (DUF952 family)
MLLQWIFCLFLCGGEKAPEVLYRVAAVEEWERSQQSTFVEVGKMDREFIHLATEEQLPRIIEKYWKGQPHVVLKLDPRLFEGRLVLEKNPGGSGLYWHLYDGRIPLCAVVCLK